MPKKVYVTSAQKSAARAMVKWSDANDGKISDSVRKIANARVVRVSDASTKAQ